MCYHLYVGLDARVSQFALEQLVDLKDTRRIAHLDLDANRLFRAFEQPYLVDRRRGEGVDRRFAHFVGDAGAAMSHIERVRDLDHARFDRQALPIPMTILLDSGFNPSPVVATDNNDEVLIGPSRTIKVQP